MLHVVAFLDQNRVATFRRAEDAPAGSTVFSTPDELAKVLLTKTMDSIRESLLGEAVEPSPSRDVAATRLWHVLSLGADFVKIPPSESFAYVRRKDAFGNDKTRHTGIIELIQLSWIPGNDYIVDFFFKKLPPQAKQIVKILMEDGRKIWTSEQANEVIKARGDEIKTSQTRGPLGIFDYYKSRLFEVKILKKVSYADFASKPEFEGMSVVLNKDEKEEESSAISPRE
jgi:hypothetical protein